MTTFPRLYTDPPIVCPLQGYEGYAFRVLLNPTGLEKDDWVFGHMGVSECAECATLNTPRGKPKEADPSKKYCVACATARDRFGRAAVAFYGTSHADGFDFSTPDTALASFAQIGLPDEMLAWLFALPSALWNGRLDEIKKKLLSPSTAGS